MCLHTFTVVKTSPTNRRISNSLQRRLKRNLTNLARAFNLSQGFADDPKRNKGKNYRSKGRSTVLLNGLIDRSLVRAPATNTRKVMLFSKNGYLLQISNNGFVNGTHDTKSDNGKCRALFFGIKLFWKVAILISNKVRGERFPDLDSETYCFDHVYESSEKHYAVYFS